jgi:hypothetical protein
MTGKIVSRQVEGGEWQANYEGGTPNQFGTGPTESAAIADLHARTLKESAEIHEPIIRERIDVAVDRLIVKKLAKPTLLSGMMATHVAYRESDPGTQSYGVDENAARVAFLTADQQRQQQPKLKT